MKPTLNFVSIGCNRLGNCASWSTNGLLAFGAGNFVGLYDNIVSTSRKTIVTI